MAAGAPLSGSRSRQAPLLLAAAVSSAALTTLAWPSLQRRRRARKVGMSCSHCSGARRSTGSCAPVAAASPASGALDQRLASKALDVAHALLFDDELEDIRLYDIRNDEEAAVEQSGGDSTYGEFSYKLLDWVLAEADVREDDIVCDLGSGGARALLYVALRSGCRESIGVELSPTRHQSALILRDLCEPFLRAAGAHGVHLHCRDITDASGVVPQRSASVILFANRLFEDEFQTRALLTVDRPRCVVSLRPLPAASLAAWSHLRLRATTTLPTSWSCKEPVYLYVG